MLLQEDGKAQSSDDDMTNEQAEEMLRKDLSNSSRQSRGGAEVGGSGGINRGAEDQVECARGSDGGGDTELEAEDDGNGERPAGSGAVGGGGGGGGGCAGPAERGGEGTAKEGEESGKSSEEGRGRQGQERDARLAHRLLLAAHCSPEQATGEADSAVAKPQPIKAVNLGEGWFEYTGCACRFVCMCACFLCSVR